MTRYKEFAPETYLSIDNGDIFVRLEGILESIVKSSVSFTDTTMDWNIDQLIKFLNEKNISIIEIDRNDCLLARNLKGETIDESADKAKKLYFLDSKSILKLVKLIQQENLLSLAKGKEFKELMFEGFYLNLKTGKFYFNCENVVDNFLNRPHYDRKFSFKSTYHEFEQFAIEKNIPIYHLETAKIEFAQIPKSCVGISQRQHDDSKYQPININDAKSSNIKVINGEGLLQLYQLTKNIKKPSNNESCHYQQSEPGIIYKKDQHDAWLDFKKDWYSIQKVLEHIQRNNSKEHIDITKKAVEKQVNKLIETNPDFYQKKLIADNDIAKNSRQLLDLSNKGGHKETYVNYAILSELEEYYYSRKTSNYPKPEPQLEYSIPLLSDFLMVTSNPQDKNEVNITINDINAANKKFNRFKSKISNCIKQETSKLNVINEQLAAKIIADIFIKQKIESCWQEDNKNYLLWQEIDKLNDEPESTFVELVKKAALENGSIYEIRLQDVTRSSEEVKNEIESLGLIYNVKTILNEISSINCEFDEINFRSSVFDKLKEINTSYVQAIRTEDRKVDYQVGVNIRVKDVQDFDNDLKGNVNKIIKKTRLKIETTKNILDQLTNEIESIILVWEDLQDELQYFNYEQISEKNRPQAKQAIGGLLKQVTTNLSL